MKLGSISVAILFGITSTIVAAQSAPICIDPPAISGTPAAATAPVGWAVAQNSPDIIAGNGPWPNFSGFTISDVSGPSPSGGSMGLFLSQADGYVETWQTTLTGLTVGQSYQVALFWQQGTGRGDPPSIDFWSGGPFRVSVDGNPTDYVGVGTASTDTWQLATKTFTATAATAVLEIGGVVGPAFRMVVADSGNACAALQPPRSTSVPTAPVAMLAVLGGLMSLLGGLVLRRRRVVAQQ